MMNQLEVAPLKNLFFLAVLKLDVKDSLKKLTGWEKPFLQYKLMIYQHWLHVFLLT